MRYLAGCVAVLTLLHSVSLHAAERTDVVFVDEGEMVSGLVEGPSWPTEAGALVGTGEGLLLASHEIEAGDFHIRAELRMANQKGSAAFFQLGEGVFGFDGARANELFTRGGVFGRDLRSHGASADVFTSGDWITFEVIREDDRITVRIDDQDVVTRTAYADRIGRIGFSPWRSTMHVRHFSASGNLSATPPPAPGLMRVTIPTIDLDDREDMHVVVDREPDQYLGHPTTALLEDGETILTVYPTGHGRGEILYKRSTDGGKTWSDRLPTPESWATSKETPTIHRVVGPDGTKRLIMWSGLHPARLSVSEDDGATWSELEPVGDWGGIVVMGFVEPLQTGEGHYLAMFHDDGRFFEEGGEATGVFTLYQTRSTDGGLTWSEPDPVWSGSDIHLCEPGVIRSPDGDQLAVLLRENRRRRNSYVIFSDDEGETWSEPRELPLALTGDRHTARYTPDGRLFISFRVISPERSRADRPFEASWGGWVGTYDDIVHGREGDYVVRVKDNQADDGWAYDCAYPGVEVLPDGTIVTTTYGHWTSGEPPYILAARFTLEELDALLPDEP